MKIFNSSHNVRACWFAVLGNGCWLVAFFAFAGESYSVGIPMSGGKGLLALIKLLFLGAGLKSPALIAWIFVLVSGIFGESYSFFFGLYCF